MTDKFPASKKLFHSFFWTCHSGCFEIPNFLYSELKAWMMQFILPETNLCINWIYIRQENMEIFHRQINMILLMNCFLVLCMWDFSLTNLLRTGVGRSDSLGGKLKVLCFSIICFKIFQVNFEIKILESNGFFSF